MERNPFRSCFTLDLFNLDYFQFKQADVTMMKFYNCHNREGFNIDGKMDANEMNFSNEFCPWQMVSGPSGTFLQSLDFEQNFAEGQDKGDILKNWYYDNDTPLGLGHYESPLFMDPYFLDKFENGTFGFHMCSALLDNQVIIYFNNSLTFCCCYCKKWVLSIYTLIYFSKKMAKIVTSQNGTKFHQI